MNAIAVAVLGLCVKKVNGQYDAVFAVPFEISFERTNEFDFSMNHLENFMFSSSVFFGVNEANISIAFVKEDDQTNNYIDVGMTVSVISLEEEKRVRDKEMNEYRTNLTVSYPTMPTVIGMDLQNEDCSQGKYATFYHFDVDCQWLCDHESFYNNETNQCHAIPSNASSIVQTMENNTKRFVLIGFGSSVALTLLLLLLFGFCAWIKTVKSSKTYKKSMNETRQSNYFYDNESNQQDEEGLDADNIALSVKSTRSNSIEPEHEN